MIKVIVEIWPRGDESKKFTVADMSIVNNLTSGNYDYVMNENSTELATGKIKKHLRNNSIWLLVMKCIKEGIKNYANKN